MTALNKQALREAAQEEIMLRSVSDTSDAWQDEASPEAVLALLDELEAAEKRIAELEARTVVVKQFDDFQIVHYGATEDYAKGYLDCQNNYNKALAAAGIGVKGE
ncbi:ead/Ea22-like family protein [Citrobacter braakii]|uniref:ead/Ea22-like family protein n=1 Tax=Citrobacter braakii TaxID=57706 RepID=UPI003975D602